MQDTSENAMSDIQLRDEIVTMIVGGHETTALAMAWVWKLLSEHPQAEAALHEEVDRVLGGRVPTLVDVEKLEWTQAVFQEGDATCIHRCGTWRAWPAKRM